MHTHVQINWRSSNICRSFVLTLGPTWLMVGRPCFFLEVVSRPQREENLLLRLLADLDMA